MSMQKLAMCLVSETQETPNTAELATIGMYGVTTARVSDLR